MMAQLPLVPGHQSCAVAPLLSLLFLAFPGSVLSLVGHVARVPKLPGPAQQCSSLILFFLQKSFRFSSCFSQSNPVSPHILLSYYVTRSFKWHLKGMSAAPGGVGQQSPQGRGAQENLYLEQWGSQAGRQACSWPCLQHTTVGRQGWLTNRNLYNNHSVRLSIKRLLDTSSFISANFICLEINMLKQEPVLHTLPWTRGLAVEWRMPVWISCK